MTDQFEPKINKLFVAPKNRGGLRNSPTPIILWAWFSRLDLAYFISQLDSPELIQRPLSYVFDTDYLSSSCFHSFVAGEIDPTRKFVKVKSVLSDVSRARRLSVDINW